MLRFLPAIFLRIFGFGLGLEPLAALTVNRYWIILWKLLTTSPPFTPTLHLCFFFYF